MRTIRILAVMVVAALMMSQAPTRAAVTVTRVSVANTATIVWTSPNNTATGRALVRNPSAVSVYLGPSTVTTANGFELAAGDAIGINLDSGEVLYGIVAGANQTVHVLQGSAPQ